MTLMAGGVVARWEMGRRVGPGLGFAPGTGGGEVDAEGAGGAVGWQDFVQAIAELWERCGKGLQAGRRGHAGQVQRVACGIEVTV